MKSKWISLILAYAIAIASVAFAVWQWNATDKALERLGTPTVVLSPQSLE